MALPPADPLEEPVPEPVEPELLPAVPEPVVPDVPEEPVLPGVPEEPVEPFEGLVEEEDEPVEPEVSSPAFLQPANDSAAARAIAKTVADFSVGAYISVSLLKIGAAVWLSMTASQTSIYLCRNRLPHETHA